MLLKIAKACLARALFGAHAFVAVWRIVDIKGHDDKYWLFASPLLLLLLEGLVSICHRGGEEHKWFCPCVFLYLCCCIPSLWVLELDWAGRRRGKHAEGPCHNVSVGAERLSPLLGLDLGIKIELPPDLWPKVLEQFLLVNLIVGRWLLPKGELTRYQLSQLLLVYIGMAADIIEILEALKEDAVVENHELPYITLGLWTLSLLQFTTVLTATKARKPRLGNESHDKGPRRVGGARKRCDCRRLCDLDMWAILTTVILQDGPFLGLRLTLIVRYNVVSYLNIFFTCKNSLMLLLQVYRLSVLCCERGRETPTEDRRDATHDHVAVQIGQEPQEDPVPQTALRTDTAPDGVRQDVYSSTERPIKPDHRTCNGTSVANSDKNLLLYGWDSADRGGPHLTGDRNVHAKRNRNHEHCNGKGGKFATMPPRYYPVDGNPSGRKGRSEEVRHSRHRRHGPQARWTDRDGAATLPRSRGKTKGRDRRSYAEELYKTRSLWEGLPYQVVLYPKETTRTVKSHYSSTKF